MLSQKSEKSVAGGGARFRAEMQAFSSECPLLSMAQQVMISAQLADADAVMAMRVEECLQR